MKCQGRYSEAALQDGEAGARTPAAPTSPRKRCGVDTAAGEQTTVTERRPGRAAHTSTAAQVGATHWTMRVCSVNGAGSTRDLLSKKS